MKFRLVILACLVVVFGYAQVPVSRGTKGPIKDSITDPKNYYVQSNNFVEKIKDFKRAQFVRLDFDFGHKVTVNDLRRFRAKILLLENRLILVTSSFCKYWKINEGVIEPYIKDDLANLDIEKWYKEVFSNEAVSNLLVSGDLTVLSLILFVPSKENENGAVRKIYDALEEVKFNPPFARIKKIWHEIKYIFWKTDIFPVEDINGPKIYLYSWPTTRFAITMGFFRDTRLKSVVAYTIFFLPFLAICFSFVPQYYLPVWIGTFLPIIFTLGSIWTLHFLNIHQSVYSLPPIVSTLIVSLSFNLQKMETFCGQKGSGAVRWLLTRKKIHLSIHLITIMTLLNFILFGWNMQSLWMGIEMDVVFVLGTFWAWVVSIFFLPAIHFLFSSFFGEEEKELRGWQKIVCGAVDRGLEKVICAVIKINLFLFQNRSARIFCYLTPLVLLGIAGLFFYQGRFNKVSEPLKYLPQNSRVVEMAKYPNRQGGPGMDAIQIIFGMPLVEDAIKTDEFFREVAEFHSRLEKISGIRGTFSIMKEVAHQIKTTADLVEPRVASAMELVQFGEESINYELIPYLHTDRFVQIFAFHPMERSDELDKTLVEVRRVASEFMARNRRLEIRVFGEVPFFAEMARLIPQQIPQIVITSLVMIFFFYIIIARVFSNNGVFASIRTGWVLTQTFAVAVGIVGIKMVLFQDPLDMATAAILPISIAAAADFNIYPTLCFFRWAFLKKSSEAIEEALKEKGQAVIVDWLGNSLCLSLLVTSYFTPIRDIGVLSMVSLAVCVVWSLVATLPLLARRR